MLAADRNARAREVERLATEREVTGECLASLETARDAEREQRTAAEQALAACFAAIREHLLMPVPPRRRPIFAPLAAAVAAAVSLAGCSSDSDDRSPGYRLASVAVDADNDGTPDSLFTWSYDAQGRALAEELDVGVDGSIEARFERVRDGDTLRIERDENADGSVEGVSTQTIDANGLLASFSREASADGDTPRSIVYTAEGGRLVGAEIDEGADGSVDITERYRYDADGRIAGVDFDFDGDGVTDDSLEVVREASGTVVRLEEDFGDDGGVDFVRTLTYEIGVCDANDIANAAVPVIDICL